MSRILPASTKGKNAPVATPTRSSRVNVRADDLQAEPVTTMKATKPRSGRPTATRRRKARIARALTTSDESASSEENTNGEESIEDDSQDESEEPIVYAPSRTSLKREAGRMRSSNSKTGLIILSEEALFSDSSDSDDDEDDEIDDVANDGDDDDDDDSDIYNALNDSSDAEEDEQDDEQHLGELWEDSIGTDPTVLLAQAENILFGLEGDSYLGLLDTTVSEDSDSYIEAAPPRHVHFYDDMEQPRVFTGSSPTMTRALLPSALPEEEPFTTAGLIPVTNGVPETQRQYGVSFEDPDDTETTDLDLPAEAHVTTPVTLTRDADKMPPPSQSAKRKSKKNRRIRGPRSGLFELDEDRVWGIHRGNKLLIAPAPNANGRHQWLEKKLESAPGSVASTPSVSLAELLDESGSSVTSSQERLEIAGQADIMLASLNSNSAAMTPQGQAVGPSSAFYAPSSDFQIMGDYIITADDDLNSDVSNEADLPFDINNFIESDDEFDADEAPITPTINMPPRDQLPGSSNFDHVFAHLNNTNVTAFKRNADPAQAALLSSPSLPVLTTREAAMIRTPTPSRKRKATNPPYSSSHYNGVTPVQRQVLHPTIKRQKLST